MIESNAVTRARCIREYRTYQNTYALVSVTQPRACTFLGGKEGGRESQSYGPLTLPKP